MARKIVRITEEIRIPGKVAVEIARILIGDAEPPPPLTRQPSRSPGGLTDIDMLEVFPEGKTVTFDTEGGFRNG